MKSLILLLSTVISVFAELAISEVEIDWEGLQPETIYPITDRAGTPVFLRELYSLRREEDFRIADHLGFNAVIETDSVTFRYAEKFGFHVTEASWYTASSDLATATAEGIAYCAEPLLISYNLNDEPDLRMNSSGPAALARAAAAIRTVDPKARFSVTLAGRGRTKNYWPDFAEVVDIMRVDPYPLVSTRPLREVKELVEAARAAAGPTKPIVTVLQAWDWPAGAFPTGPQIRQMVWQSLIAGSNGLSYFDWNYEVWAQHPDFWRELVEINKEIQELELFLIEGVKYPAIEKDDVYATVWQHRERGWCALLTRMGEQNDTVMVRLQLPAAVQHSQFVLINGSHSAVGDGGAIEVALLPLGSVIVRPYVFVQGDGSQRLEKPESYTTDLAGRQWRRQRSSRTRETAYAVHRMSMRLSGVPAEASSFDQAGPVVECFPGGGFANRLQIDPGTARHVTVTPVSWHDTRESITGVRLRSIVSIERIKTRLRRSHGASNRARRDAVFDIEVNLPADHDWPSHRDHLLTVKVDFTTRGREQASTTRVIRYRLRDPFEFEWRWHQGDLSAKPTFPESCYPEAFSELVPRITTPGITHHIAERRSPTNWRIDLGCAGTADRVATLTCELGPVDAPLATVELSNLRCEDGVVLAPTMIRTVDVLRTPQKPDLGVFSEFVQGRAPLKHFLQHGAWLFSEDGYLAWLMYDDENLYWLMESQSPAVIRAETEGIDQPFLADDTASLLIAGPEHDPLLALHAQTTEGALPPSRVADSVYRIAVNAAGAVHHVQALPAWDLSWNPEVQVEAAVDGRTWRSVVAIPWVSIGWSGPPESGTSLWLNIGAGRSVAPRISSAWSYMHWPFDIDRALGRAIVR